MTVYAITDTKKGILIAPTYLHTTPNRSATSLTTLILLVSVGFVQFGGGNHVVNFYQPMDHAGGPCSSTSTDMTPG